MLAREICKWLEHPISIWQAAQGLTRARDQCGQNQNLMDLSI